MLWPELQERPEQREELVVEEQRAQRQQLRRQEEEARSNDRLCRGLPSAVEIFRAAAWA